MSDSERQRDEDEGRLIKLRAAANQNDGGWYLALRDFTVPKKDGADGEPDAAKPVILVFAAMGAPARAYRRLARWFAEQGYAIATIDTRGTGESTPQPKRGIDFGVSKHLYEDWPAAIAWARATYPNRRIVLMGHSIGGQLSGLYTGLNPGVVSALVLLTTTSVWWKSSSSWKRRIGTFIMFGVFAATARLLGWFPGQRFNWGLPLARQVVLDWAHWGFSGSYYDTERRNLDGALAKVTLPTLSISFSDDLRLAPGELCDDFVRRMPTARLTRWHLMPDEIGLQEASHFTHLRGAPVLWQRIDQWLQQIKKAA